MSFRLHRVDSASLLDAIHVGPGVYVNALLLSTPFLTGMDVMAGRTDEFNS